jgi:hypothetical protein
MILLFADLNDVFWLYCLVPSATLSVEKAQQLLQSLSISCIAEKGAFASHGDQIFAPELVEVMGESGIRDSQFVLDFPNDETLGMRCQ